MALVLFLSASVWCQVSPKKRIAIFDFDNAAVQGGVSTGFFQTNGPDIGKGVSELLIAKLVQDGTVTVIERSAIDKVLAEQNLTNSDRTDPVTAAKLGRVLGVDAIVLGTITHYEYDEKIKGHANPFPGMVGASSGTKAKYDIRAKIAISGRVVSPDTAEVLSVCEGVGETNRKNVKTDLRDVGGRVLMASGANSPVMSESVDKAVAQLAASLEPQFAKLPQRSPVIDGLVADASDSGKLVLNVGAHDGLRVGDHLQVLRAGKEIHDPVTGKLLMRDDTLLGEAVITSVNDVSAVAQYNGAEPAKVRDVVRSIPKQH
ncbi:MAG TPA: CsgG/HfaB family protein [Terriglobales bacterium]|nr:CsgG/HfaB family protein [Terriglobales bacterium]